MKSPESQEVLHRRYAKALFEVARETGSLEEVFENITAFARALDEHAGLRKVLFHPEIADEKKQEVLTQIGAQLKFCEQFLDFLKFLVDKNRLEILYGIRQKFSDLYDEAKDQRKAVVKTAVSLTESQVDGLAKALSRRFGKKILVEEKIRPDILGGIYVRVGDEIYDGTAAGRLEKLRKAVAGT